MTDLDHMAQQSAQRIVTGAAGVQPTDVENVVTKALGVVQENGIYAGMLFLLTRSRTSDKQVADAAKPVLLDIARRLTGTKDVTNNPNEILKFLTDKVRKFELIETALFDPGAGPKGAFWLLDGHVARLQRSAAHFGFKCDEAKVRAALAEKGVGSQHLRVRLLLAEDGSVTVTATPIAAPVAGAEIGYMVSPTRVNSAEPFLAHKTTERQLYDREWQQFHDTVGADEVVYLNEKGELVEGSRTTIFIERDGVLLTPPLSAGALPGVLRAQLMAEGRAVERTLTLADLKAAEVVYLGNSVRGLQRAKALVT